MSSRAHAGRRAAGALAAAALALGGCDVIERITGGGDDDALSAEGSGAPVADGSGEREAQVSALPEVEPNDAAETAMRISSGRPVSGALSDGDVDVFMLPAAVAVSDLSVEGEGVTRVFLSRPQDASGYDVPRGDDGAFTARALDRAASLHVSVEGAGAYTLSLDDRDGDAACGFGREPDDVANPGVVLASVPSVGVGCIHVPNDLDVFVLPRAAWEDAEGFGVAVSAVSGLALDVRVKAEDGRILARMTGEEGSELTFPNLAVPTEGDLFIEVRSQAGANEMEPYRLSLRRLPPLSGAIELEPNDSATAPTALDAIGLVNGFIHRSGDVDHYRLTTASEEHQLVRLLAESPPGVDLRVEVTGGPMGSLVIDESGPGEQEKLCSLNVDAAEGFAFSVSAASFQTTEVEPYLLHFELLEGTNWEAEPNGTLEDALAMRGEASTVPIGIWLGDATVPFASGYTFPPGDVDRYAIEVSADPAAAATYQSVTLRLEPNGVADYTLSLVDEDGATVAVASNGGAGEIETISLDLPAGVYVAEVSFVSGDSCGRPYRLSGALTAFPEPVAPVDPLLVPAELVGVLGEGSGEGADGGEGAEGGDGDEGDAPTIERPEMRQPRPVRVAPPPTAPRVGPPTIRSPAGLPRVDQVPQRAPGEQPPTFGGTSGR